MIREVKVFQATCDNCAEPWQMEESGMTLTAWESRPGLTDQIQESGWHVTRRGKHYCPKCHAFDTDGTLIIMEEREVQQ
ncbi:hypothetical protein [Rufibacter soli]